MPSVEVAVPVLSSLMRAAEEGTRQLSQIPGPDPSRQLDAEKQVDGNLFPSGAANPRERHMRHERVQATDMVRRPLIAKRELVLVRTLLPREVTTRTHLAPAGRPAGEESSW